MINLKHDMTSAVSTLLSEEDSTIISTSDMLNNTNEEVRMNATASMEINTKIVQKRRKMYGGQKKAAQNNCRRKILCCGDIREQEKNLNIANNKKQSWDDFQPGNLPKSSCNARILPVYV